MFHKLLNTLHVPWFWECGMGRDIRGWSVFEVCCCFACRGNSAIPASTPCCAPVLAGQNTWGRRRISSFGSNLMNLWWYPFLSFHNKFIIFFKRLVDHFQNLRMVFEPFAPLESFGPYHSHPECHPFHQHEVPATVSEPIVRFASGRQRSRFQKWRGKRLGRIALRRPTCSVIPMRPQF